MHRFPIDFILFCTAAFAITLSLHGRDHCMAAHSWIIMVFAALLAVAAYLRYANISQRWPPQSRNNSFAMSLSASCVRKLRLAKQVGLWQVKIQLILEAYFSKGPTSCMNYCATLCIMFIFGRIMHVTMFLFNKSSKMYNVSPTWASSGTQINTLV